MAENKMTHCPKCHKPVLNGGQFWGSAQFTIKCPWCQTVIVISVQPQIVARLKNPEPMNGFSPVPEYGQSSEPTGFESPARTAQVGEDGFKVVGYIYPQNENQPPG